MTDPQSLEQAKAHFLQGNTHFEAHRFEDALASFQAALALGAYAVPTLEAATKADPAHRDAWLALAHAHEALQQWAPALSALQRAQPLGPATVALWMAQARYHLRLDRPQPALQALDAALALDPTLAEAWSERGSLLREAGHNARGR
ncbi:MAG: tetratricopeptide repeat protein [Hydrogenophaga sp.]|nr:tetratricopeptide repeat protein [Hydrogenophaga sp.]